MVGLLSRREEDQNCRVTAAIVLQVSTLGVAAAVLGWLG